MVGRVEECGQRGKVGDGKGRGECGQGGKVGDGKGRGECGRGGCVWEGVRWVEEMRWVGQSR